MDYIILNNDGSIANLPSLVNPKLKRYIQQGNSGVDKIFIGWPLGLSTDYGQAVFTLANQLTNTVLGVFKENYPYEADDPENPPSDYDGETCNGWVITLTSDQTIYNGGLFVSFRVIRNGIVQVAFPFTLMINETGIKPDTDSGVTIAQLDSYLLNIQNLVTDAVRQNTDATMSETSENPVQNKVVTTRINQAIAGVYKPGGSIDVATLNAAPKPESLNGYVFNMTDSGNLVNYDGTSLEVRAGDNVCFLWNDGDWKFDNMVGVVGKKIYRWRVVSQNIDWQDTELIIISFKDMVTNNNVQGIISLLDENERINAYITSPGGSQCPIVSCTEITNGIRIDYLGLVGSALEVVTIALYDTDEIYISGSEM